MLKKSDLNFEVKSVIASGPAGTIWLYVNPAADTKLYRLEVGDAYVESKDIDKILDTYNKREEK